MAILSWKVILSKSLFYEHYDSVEYERRTVKYGVKAVPLNKRNLENYEDISINEAIGILWDLIVECLIMNWVEVEACLDRMYRIQVINIGSIY